MGCLSWYSNSHPLEAGMAEQGRAEGGLWHPQFILFSYILLVKKDSSPPTLRCAPPKKKKILPPSPLNASPSL